MLFVLDKKEKMVSVLNNLAPAACPYFDDIHTENLETGVNTYEFSVPAAHESAEKLETDGYVIFRDLDERMQMFQIKEIEEVGSDTYDKRIYSEHVAIPELLACPFRPQKFVGLSLKQAVNLVLQNSGWEIGQYDWEGIVDIEFEEYISALEALYQVVSAYDAEIQYEVLFINGEISKRLVHVMERRGVVTNKRFTYGKDLAEVKRTVNSEGIVTALIGIGKGDDSGTRLTFSTYDPDTDGQKVALPRGYEKPVSADWVGSTEALQEYGKNGRHLFGVYVDDAATNVETLLANTIKELQARSKPKTTYEMRIALLERLAGINPAAEKTRIGDTINIDDITFNPRLAVEARLIEMKRSYTLPENDECTLGDYRPIKLASLSTIEKIQQKISESEQMWKAANYKVEIHSSDGLMFKDNMVNTVLSAVVYRNGKDITNTVDGSCFRWTRKSLDAVSDAVWNDEHFGGTKTIFLTGEDVRVRATFSCDVDIETGVIF